MYDLKVKVVKLKQNKLEFKDSELSLQDIFKIKCFFQVIFKSNFVIKGLPLNYLTDISKLESVRDYIDKANPIDKLSELNNLDKINAKNLLLEYKEDVDEENMGRVRWELSQMVKDAYKYSIFIKQYTILLGYMNDGYSIYTIDIPAEEFISNYYNCGYTEQIRGLFDEAVKSNIDINYINIGYNYKQIKFLVKCLMNGQDIKYFNNPRYDYYTMVQLVKAKKDGVNLYKYADDGYIAINQIRLALKYGIDIDLFITKEMSAKDVYNILRRRTYVKANKNVYNVYKYLRTK